jgi:hypothetical protein
VNITQLRCAERRSVGELVALKLAAPRRRHAMQNVQADSIGLSQGFQLPFGAKAAIFLAVIAVLTYASVALAPQAGDEATLSSEYASSE